MPLRQRPPTDRARRALLKAARNATSAGAAVAVLGPASASAEAPLPAEAAAPAPAAAQPRGYHETDHTRRYYALARF
jgi:hypothetical protein